MAKKNNGIRVYTNADEGAVIEGLDRAMIRWVGTGLTAGQAAILKDANGEKVWESVAMSANVLDTFPLNLRQSLDITLDTLDGGTLYVYPM